MALDKYIQLNGNKEMREKLYGKFKRQSLKNREPMDMAAQRTFEERNGIHDHRNLEQAYQKERLTKGRKKGRCHLYRERDGMIKCIMYEFTDF